MNLAILVPGEVLLKAEGVEAVIAEAENGSFGLLEHHADFATALVPGILAYREGSRTHYVAVDEGILVKTGPAVQVAVRAALAGKELGRLGEVIRRQYREQDESERKAREASARLEAALLRRLQELRHV